MKPYAAAALAMLLASAGANARATPCVYTPSDSKSLISSGQFFEKPRGAVAIGQECDDSTNVCAQNFDISGCEDVAYTVPFDQSSISIVVNTSRRCAHVENCPIEAGYLAAAVVYFNDAKSHSHLPGVEVIRNPGWFKPHSFERKYRVEFDKILAEEEVKKFFQMQSSQTATLSSFESDVVKYFHATAFEDEPDSWAHRDVFGTAFSDLNQCRPTNNLCTLKSFLLKFSETPNAIPSNALRLNFAIDHALAVHITTFSPIGSSIYNRGITINFQWPTPLPQPRPAAAIRRG